MRMMVAAAYLIGLTGQALAQTSDPAVGQARAHYNAGRPTDALAALRPVLEHSGAPAPAALVAARALLEQYRQSADPADLDAARDHLRALDARALSAAEQVELVVGLAEALYLEDAFAASAEMFETSLGVAAFPLTGVSRDRVLDWWATALDRHAQLKPAAERRSVYARMTDRMARESRDAPTSAPAAYWLAAAARGAGELDRAWAAAIAAWVRAPMTPDRGAALRADIDRLVLQALVPERARAAGVESRETAQIARRLLAEWEAVKERWSRQPS